MFKVGDKVNLCNPLGSPQWKYKGVVGTVVNLGTKIRVAWDINQCVICGCDCGMIFTIWSYWPKEIKLVSRKGQQLLFEFML